MVSGVMINIGELRQMQSLPLAAKIIKSQQRIREWYEMHDGRVYVAYSGGKDSTALLHLVRSVYPGTPAVFYDTGLEFPEIREFVKATPNVVMMRPQMLFSEVLLQYGYPVISKNVAQFIEDLRRPEGVNDATKHLRLTGMTQDGRYLKDYKLPKRWEFLLKAPFMISAQCCEMLKHEPMRRYQKEIGAQGYVGILAEDSKQRERQYLRTGCNLYSNRRGRSAPLGFWTRADIWQYIRENSIPYSHIYDMGYETTGCIFCGFGIMKHLDRFTMLYKTHPALHDYCINRLGLGRVLDYIGVPYGPCETQGKLFIATDGGKETIHG